MDTYKNRVDKPKGSVRFRKKRQIRGLEAERLDSYWWTEANGNTCLLQYRLMWHGRCMRITVALPIHAIIQSVNHVAIAQRITSCWHRSRASFQTSEWRKNVMCSHWLLLWQGYWCQSEYFRNCCSPFTQTNKQTNIQARGEWRLQ